MVSPGHQLCAVTDLVLQPGGHQVLIELHWSLFSVAPPVSVVTADTRVCCNLDPLSSLSSPLPRSTGVFTTPRPLQQLYCTSFSSLRYRLYCQLASSSFGVPPMVPLGVSYLQEPFT